jgi:antirestriction protein
MTDELHPRIYVASLSDYNAGRLHGVWIDVTQDAESCWQQVQSMLATSTEPGAEEFAIHDYENFGHLYLDEYANLDQVFEIGRGIAEHGGAFACWADQLGSSAWDELGTFSDHYLGSYPSRRDYTEQLLDDLGIDLDPSAWAPAFIAEFVHVDVEALSQALVSVHEVCDTGTAVHFFEP